MPSPASTSERRTAPATASSRRARLILRCLLVPVLLKVIWLHFFCSQGQQFVRLGRQRGERWASLPEVWASWAASRIARFISRMPVLRRRPCYWRSQLMFDLLPRFGFPVRLHLGVPSEGPAAAPHLWVTLRGTVLSDLPECRDRYLEMAVYPTETRRD